MVRRRARDSYDEYQLPWGAGSIDARGNKFLARWRENGKPKTQMFDTQASAHVFLMERWQRQQRGITGDIERLTVAELVDQSIERKVHLSPNTVRLYRNAAKRLINPTLGKERVTLLTRARIQHWIDTTRRLGFSLAWLATGRVVLFTALQEAYDFGIIPQDVTVRLRLPKHTTTESERWNPDEVRALMNHVATMPKIRRRSMWLALYHVFFSTGARPGEVLALQWSDIDWAEKTVRIRVTWTVDEHGREVVGTTTKTKQERLIPLPEVTMASLEVWFAEANPRNLDAPIWVNNFGTVLRPASWRSRHRSFCLGAKVPAYTPHKSRHTFATRMSEHSVNPKVASTILGHSSAKIMLDKYVHVSLEAKRSAIDLFEEDIG